jgi:hypothetical protein
MTTTQLDRITSDVSAARRAWQRRAVLVGAGFRVLILTAA